jgi:hypothetical protein
MACESMLKPRQTIQQRADEVRRAIAKIAESLASGRVKAKVGPQGAVAFTGITAEERDGLTDVCIYRRIMVSGSALAKAQLARAEQMAGRSVNRSVLAHGTHSHDGGATWHGGHKR